MHRYTLSCLAICALVGQITAGVVAANDGSQGQPVDASYAEPTVYDVTGQPVAPASFCPPGAYGYAPYGHAAQCPPGYGYGYGAGYGAGGPNLDAALYPCPRPDVPAEVGGTLITNEALYPQEMLYAHKYKALYPPFYYKTNWRYGLRWTNCKTPLGFSIPVLQKVKVATSTHLKGTCVKVQYKSQISPLAFFSPPR